MLHARIAALLVGISFSCKGDGKPSPTPTPATSTTAASSTVTPANGSTPSSAGSSSRAADPAAYKLDIEALCDVIRRSGADSDPNATMVTVAQWLAANLKTPESKQFLARIQPLVGDDKANALDAEARAVGLGSCALAAEWRTSPTP